MTNKHIKINKQPHNNNLDSQLWRDSEAVKKPSTVKMLNMRISKIKTSIKVYLCNNKINIKECSMVSNNNKEDT